MTAPVLASVTIPVIDFGPFIAGCCADQQRVAQEIYRACHHIGFMYLKNHGVPSNLLQPVFQQSHDFFALPCEVKQHLAWADELSNRGYVGIKRERLNPKRPGDAKECFNVGKEDDTTVSSGSQSVALVQNRWPSDQEEFRQTLLDFFDACVEASQRVLLAFELALQLPTDFLVNLHTQGEHTLRLLHYPPLDQPLEPEQIRAGEHSDYGSLTLLFQDDVGGLEVQSRSGDWLFAPCIPGTLLVNTGDLMERWTNDVFRSTQHRVGVPTGDRSHRSRYSIAFFCHPNRDAEIRGIESCLEPGATPKYPPIRAGDHLIHLLQATY